MSQSDPTGGKIQPASVKRKARNYIEIHFNLFIGSSVLSIIFYSDCCNRYHLLAWTHVFKTLPTHISCVRLRKGFISFSKYPPRMLFVFSTEDILKMIKIKPSERAIQIRIRLSKRWSWTSARITFSDIKLATSPGVYSVYLNGQDMTRTQSVTWAWAIMFLITAACKADISHYNWKLKHLD